MNTTRRRAALLLALAPALAGARAGAADYPTKPIRLIVPYAPGGGADAVARVLARHIGDAVGQSIVVENRGGAGSIIGTDMVAKAGRQHAAAIRRLPALAPASWGLTGGCSSCAQRPEIGENLRPVRPVAVRPFGIKDLAGTQPPGAGLGLRSGRLFCVPGQQQIVASHERVRGGKPRR